MTLRTIERETGCSKEQLSEIIGVSIRSIRRWEKKDTQPKPLAVRRIGQLEKIFDKAHQLFKKERLKKWFNSPNLILGNRTPLEAMKSLDGTYEVMQLLERIEWGIPV